MTKVLASGDSPITPVGKPCLMGKYLEVSLPRGEGGVKYIA